MKLERLLSIVTLLLNRDQMTAKELAERFEVSERTIQRDMDSINLAGIPVVSLRGIKGGYQLLDTFKLRNQMTSSMDLKAIEQALISLNSAVFDKQVSNTLEKVKSIQSSNHHVHVDFGVASENEHVSKHIAIIKEAIERNKKIKIDYTNAKGESSQRILEPVSVAFKWYAWYKRVLAQCYYDNY